LTYYVKVENLLKGLQHFFRGLPAATLCYNLQRGQIYETKEYFFLIFTKKSKK